MYGTSNLAPAVGGVASGAVAASTQSGAAAVLAFTGVALATYVALGLLLLVLGVILQWVARTQARHS